jgi:hypothetical protein
MKKLQIKLQELINTYGYWSKEVYDFNNSLPYYKMHKLNNSVTKYPKN